MTDSGDPKVTGVDFFKAVFLELSGKERLLAVILFAVGAVVAVLFLWDNERELKDHLTQIGIAVVTAAVVFPVYFVLAAKRVYDKQRSRIVELAGRSPLRNEFSPGKHRRDDNDGQHVMFRVSVVKMVPEDLGSIVLRISAISGPRQATDLEEFERKKLCRCENPHVDPEPLSKRVKDGATLLQGVGDEAFFDFVRLCKRPGKFRLWHSNVLRNKACEWPDFGGREGVMQQPDGTLEAGKYTITLMATGNGIEPTEETFEFWSRKDRVEFRQVST